MGQKGLTFDDHFERTFAEVNLVHVAVFDLQTKAFGLFAQLHHHLGSTDAFGVPGEVFDVAGQHQLAARHVARKHQRD